MQLNQVFILLSGVILRIIPLFNKSIPFAYQDEVSVLLYLTYLYIQGTFRGHYEIKFSSHISIT